MNPPAELAFYAVVAARVLFTLGPMAGLVHGLATGEPRWGFRLLALAGLLFGLTTLLPYLSVLLCASCLGLAARNAWLRFVLLSVVSTTAIVVGCLAVQLVILFAVSAPTALGARLLCASTQRGSSLEQFRFRAEVLELQLLERYDGTIGTRSNILLSGYGCEAVVDAEGKVRRAEFWSTR